MAGPLLDMAKLDDVSGDFVATLSGEQILERVLPWADAYDKDLAAVLRADRDLALRALRIERVDTDNPRKDLRKWSEFRRVYGFFFPSIFELVTDPADERFGGLPPELVRELAARFAAGYVAPGPDVAWFEQIRTLAGSLGFALKAEGLQEGPGRLPGLDRRRRGGHPGAADRDPAVAGPGAGRGRARPRRGAAPGHRARLAATADSFRG